ncbi:hypothetical protein LINPERHAP1_LOCUS175 [Linum perenne]
MRKLFMTTFLGLMFGFFLGVSLPTLFISEMNLPSGLLPSFDITYMEDKYSALSPHAMLNAFSSLRGHSSKSLLYHKHNGTKVRMRCEKRNRKCFMIASSLKHRKPIS